MKYLFAPPATDTDVYEPVIPNFPTGAQNTFLTIPSFRAVHHVLVEDRPAPSLDDLLLVLKKQFPGLPEELLSTYLLETATAAHTYELGTKLQIFVTEDEAKLMNTNTGQLLYLWKTQPIPERFKT